MSALAFLLLCFYTAVVSGEDSTDSVWPAAPGDVVILPCYDLANVTPSVTSWTKNGVAIISGGPAAPASASGGPGGSSGGDSRFEVLHDGSLNIPTVSHGDEGLYLCSATLPGNKTFQARALLQVASEHDNVSVVIDTHYVLPNGTYTAIKGSTVYIICSGDSYPSPELTLSFTGLMYSNNSLGNNTGSQMEYIIENVQPEAQGIYTCAAHNQVSHQRVNSSAALLVYYASDRHPECMWTHDDSFVLFHCSWLGAYPTPNLTWTDSKTGEILKTDEADSVVLRINSSRLSEGQQLQCKARHQTLREEDDKSCIFTLKAPYPFGEPLAAALEGTNITLKCSESTSTPPANTTWRKGLKQDLILNSSKYIVTEDGSLYSLTIINITKDDEGVFFCRSENPLGAKVLEVYLTVKTSSAFTGAVIGLFIAVLIVGSAIIIAKTVYSSRHRICLGGFGRMEEDGGDVLSLVESDDEQIFQDAVPRLPPVTNGCQTTLVEIHRIPSTDHEEPETIGAKPQENTDKTEETDDLVTF